jgi:5'-3' exonuclease
MEFKACNDLPITGRVTKGEENKTAIALFDGDIIVYRAGFAAEKREYFDSRNPPEEGGSSFSTKKEALTEIKEVYLEYKRNLEPLANALQNAKGLIDNSLEDLKENHGVTVDNYMTFLSGNDQKPNFRLEIDPEYKANRDPAHKPTYIKELVDYLVKNHKGFLTQGCEADDFFGHAQSDITKQGLTPIIVSIDKDLKQLSGLHYNLVKRELTEVSPSEASIMFWRQMLEGDTIDNIKGIKGIGKARALKYLPDSTTDEQAKEIVIAHYKRDYANEWKEQYNKNCSLLWIWRRIPDECPHKV